MLVRGRELFRRFKPLILFLVMILKMFPKSWRNKMLVGVRRITGYPGLVVRYALLKTLAASCGDNVSIHPDVYLFSVSQMTVGNNVSIHPMCYIDASGKVDIGDDVSIAHNCSILSFEHTFEEEDIPIKDQRVKMLPVKIENDIWLGAKATILGGTTIKSGCVIGAGSVVTKDTEARSVYVGVPAKKIRER